MWLKRPERQITKIRILCNLSFLAVLFLAASLSAYAGPVQLNLNFDNSNSGQASALCGVTLRASVVRLKQQVEKMYGESVECHAVPGLDQSAGDFAKISFGSSDGKCVPMISLDAERGIHEIDVTHELEHAELAAEGFPLLLPIPPVGVDGKQLSYAVRILRDLLEHRLMYPRMRMLGFDPAARGRRAIDAAIVHPKPRAVQDPNSLRFTLYYLNPA